MHPAKCQRRRKDRNVAGLQAVHGLLVSVEADKPALRRHRHAVAALPRDRVVAPAQAILKDIRHGHELEGTAFGGKRVGGGASAAATAPYEGYLNELAAGGMDMWEGHACQRRDGGQAASGFNKVATCRKRIRRFVHMQHLPDEAGSLSIQEICMAQANRGRTLERLHLTPASHSNPLCAHVLYVWPPVQFATHSTGTPPVVPGGILGLGRDGGAHRGVPAG